MGSSKLNLGGILASVNNESDLDESNVIEKIKSKLNKENSAVHQNWEKDEFDINYSFTVKNGYPKTEYNKVTLLYIATAIGATNLVKALLEVSEIDVDKQVSHFSSDGLTPLQLAAMEGYKEIAELLIAKDANVNKCSRNYPEKDTPLYLAVEKGHTGLVRFLVEKTEFDKRNIKALLDRAAENDYTGIVACIIGFLLKKNVVDVIGDGRNNLLHYAAGHCDETTILALINKNLDPWLKNHSGETPVDIYVSKRGSGYLMQLKKAKSKSTIACYLTMALGAAVIVSLFATDKIAPGMIAPIIVTPWMLCIIGVVMFLLAFIAKHITYKVCKPSAETKEMHNLDITDTKKEMDDKEKSANPEELARQRKFLVEEYGSSSLKGLADFLNPREQEKGNFSIELVDPTKLGGSVTLEDVIVSDPVRKELTMICGRISEKKKAALQSLGCKMPTGYIFYGPPGNGKTLLARAIACEANAKFISVSGSECMQKYSGQSAHYIKDLFKKARENAPCIVFIDEIDAVCTKRSDGNTGSDKEDNRIVNQFLAELNGFHSTEGVTVIAATNRLESLDEAVVRSGRLSKHIKIPLPEKEQRKKILNLYLKKGVDAKRVTMPENAEALAEKTDGFSGADLEELVNEAKIHAVDRMSNKELEKGNIEITMNDFDSAISDLKKKKPQKSENGQVGSNIRSDCAICNHAMQSFHPLHAHSAH